MPSDDFSYGPVAKNAPTAGDSVVPSQYWDGPIIDPSTLPPDPNYGLDFDAPSPGTPAITQATSDDMARRVPPPDAFRDPNPFYDNPGQDLPTWEDMNPYMEPAPPTMSVPME